MDPRPPADARKVVDAIGESHILVAILARAVVVAISSLTVRCHVERAQHILEELAVPVVRPSQHGGNVMPTDQN